MRLYGQDGAPRESHPAWNPVLRCFRWNRFSLKASSGGRPGAKLPGRRPPPRGGSKRKKLIEKELHTEFALRHEPKNHPDRRSWSVWAGFYSTENSEEPVRGIREGAGANTCPLRAGGVRKSTDFRSDPSESPPDAACFPWVHPGKRIRRSHRGW